VTLCILIGTCCALSAIAFWFALFWRWWFIASVVALSVSVSLVWLNLVLSWWLWGDPTDSSQAHYRAIVAAYLFGYLFLPLVGASAIAAGVTQALRGRWRQRSVDEH
jgi:hypothetical protein